MANKVSVYSLADLKNTTDDALANYLNSISFTQSHSLTDVRLSLGYTAVAIAGALFYADWKLGWDVTRPYTLPAVIAYAILNAAFTYWMFVVEKGVVYVGERKGTKVAPPLLASRSAAKHSQVTITTTADKLTPVYRVKAQITSGSDDKTVDLAAPFSRWFGADGYFVARPFQHFLAAGIAPVGDADPKNAAAPAEPVQQVVGGKAQSMSVNIDDLSGVLEHIQKQSEGKPRRKA
jgi:hypothetical protein